MIAILLDALGYVAPLLAFLALAAVVVGLLLPDREHRDARARNAPVRQARGIR